MIKIYSQKDFDKLFIWGIVNDRERWSYPAEELDYLIKEHDNESFIYAQVNLEDRLYEYEEGEYVKH